ncbi:hypothetical protein ABZ639_12045 [Saccharomonospora sp. NPDC006951]
MPATIPAGQGPAGHGGEELAYTGTGLAMPATLAALLTLTGALLLAVTARRGRHRHR